MSKDPGYSNSRIDVLGSRSRELESKVKRLEKTVKKLRELAEMVRDNTKMPHQHADPQLRLYCLAERADEILGGRK